MDKLNLPSFETTGAVILAALVIYLSTILLTRISGKRSFAKMSSFDFAMTVAVGALIGTTILSPSVPLVHGVIGLSSLYFMQHLVGYLRRYRNVDFLVTNKPIFLMKGSEVLQENLKKAHITENDLKARLRKANITHRNEILAVIFETSGEISVLHAKDKLDVEDWLLEGIK